MPKCAIVVPASCNQAFLSQIAALHRAVFAIGWTRWEPSVHVVFGGPLDAAALERWRPHLDGASITFVPPREFDAKGIWAQADAELTAAPRDADVVLAMDADTMLVGDIEPLLDRVLAERAVAGCMAHHRMPGMESLSEREAWAEMAAGLTGAPLEFVHRYSLAPGAEPAPFYLNFGAVFLESSTLQRILRHFVPFRTALAARMPKPVFSAQVALTLAAAEAGVPRIVLPERYNFPNDPAAARLHPEELRKVAVFHYLRTREFDRAEIFASAEAYDDFMSRDLAAVNRVFRDAVRRVLGSRYPFGAAGAEPTALPAATSRRIAALDVEIQSSPAVPAAELRLMRNILATGLFDQAYYLANVPELAETGADPLHHYVTTGEAQGHRPNPWFDPAHYRRQGPDAAAATNALLHYAQYGESAGADAGPDFSAREYVAANPDETGLAAAPLHHWITKGQGRGLSLRLPGSHSLHSWRKGNLRALDRLMAFRKALVAEFGVDRGFAAYRVALGLPDDAVLVRRPLTAQVDAARARGAPFRMVTPGGAPFRLPAPMVIGPGQLGPIQGRSRSLYLACLPDAVVRGASSLVIQGEAAILDAEGAEFTCMDIDHAFDPAVFHADEDGRHLWTIEGDRPETRSLDEAFSLLGARTIAFGHWMWEQLPKFAQARLAGLDPSVPVLIETGLPAAHRQSLEALYPGIRLVEVAPFDRLKVGRLWVAPTLHYAPLFERRTERFSWSHWAAPVSHARGPLADLGNRAERLAAGVPQDARIYLARRPGTHRLLMNQDRIEAMVAARGYRVVYPETLSFAEQVRLIRSARVVAAPDGSATFLMLLARPGTRLCLLTSSHTEPHGFFTGLLAAARTEMVIVSGPIVTPHPDWPEWADYEIDPAEMAAVLDRLEQPAPSRPHPQTDGAEVA